MPKRIERSSSTISSVCAVAARTSVSPLAMSLLHGEVEEHGGAVVLAARHLDGAAMLVHDGLRDRQPQPGALGFGREERVEQLRQNAAWHAHAGVAHAHLLVLDPPWSRVLVGAR